MRANIQPAIHLCRPLAGYGHRPSQTQRQGLSFGGAWLPPGVNGAGNSPAELDQLALAGSTPAVQQWVMECRQLKPDIKRGDLVTLQLVLPAEDNSQCQCHGVYELVEEHLYGDAIRLILDVPLVTNMFTKPAWKYKGNSSAIKNLDDVWEVLQWRQSERAKELFGEFRTLRPELVYLASKRFHGLNIWFNMPISPRLASFVCAAQQMGVAREATALACLLECAAATFSPSLFYAADGIAGEVPSVADHGPEILTPCPLQFLLGVMEDVAAFLRDAQDRLHKDLRQSKSLWDCKVHRKKLFKASDLWWKMGNGRRSFLSPLEQSVVLADLLADTFPEQVALPCGDKCGAFVGWFAGGYRVRGKELDNVAGAPRALLFSPRVEIHGKKDPYLKASFCVPLSPTPPGACQWTLVLSCDSTLREHAFIYGLACVLRQAGIRLLWVVTKDGGCAADLRETWGKAPACDFGLTIWNLNDVTRNGWVCDAALRDEIGLLVAAAKPNCRLQSSFVVNHPGFFPDLRPDCYPSLVRGVQALLREQGAEVYDGNQHLGRTSLGDSMHFALRSTEAVVAMYSDIAINMVQSHVQVQAQQQSMGPSVADQGAANPSPTSDSEEWTATAVASEDSVADAPPAAGIGESMAHEADEDGAGDSEGDQTIIDEFLQAVRRAVQSTDRRNRSPGEIDEFIRDQVRPQISDPPFGTKRPAALAFGDDRFEKAKFQRRYVCDCCGRIVTFSSKQRGTGNRVVCEFAGSYLYRGWSILPGAVQKQAYESRLIDCTWYCSQFCAAPTTGGGKQDRLQRPANFRAARGR